MIGGSLANAPSALKQGASFTAPALHSSLRIHYTLLDGDINDQVTGDLYQSLADAQFPFYWVPTSFDDFEVGSVGDCCVSVGATMTASTLFSSAF